MSQLNNPSPSTPKKKSIESSDNSKIIKRDSSNKNSGSLREIDQISKPINQNQEVHTKNDDGNFSFKELKDANLQIKKGFSFM